MCRIRYFVLGFLLTGSFATNSRAEATEKEGSWKYLVERTTTQRDNLTNKEKVYIDRAFVFFGAGAKQAGGQIKSVPQVVYVDEDGDRLAKAVYYESAIVPILKVTSSSRLLKKIPYPRLLMKNGTGKPPIRALLCNSVAEQTISSPRMSRG